MIFVHQSTAKVTEVGLSCEMVFGCQAHVLSSYTLLALSDGEGKHVAMVMATKYCIIVYLLVYFTSLSKLRTAKSDFQMSRQKGGT